MPRKLWLMRTGHTDPFEVRREAGAARFTTFPTSIGSFHGDLATGFAEDHGGTVWICFQSGRVVRIERDGHYAPVSFDPLLPRDTAYRLEFDLQGRLWVLSEGAQVADEPLAATVRLRPASPVLAGAQVYCAVQDDSHRMYFGTDRGIYRLDENLGAASVELTPDDLRDVDSAASKIQVEGARYPEHLERMTGR